jgi:NADPH:quinone reductase-like Zn-dependent oxidoreductase
MKAVVYHEYGSADVLRYEDVEKPTAGDNEVLMRVRAAAANPLDWRLMSGRPSILRLFFGLHKPKLTRPGRDVAGHVEAVGRNVTRFKPGDEVLGVCLGAFAEYACASESKLVIKPDGVTFEQAASVPVAGYTALQALRDQGRIRQGQKVLINGAGGGVGAFAVQIAKSFGAEVTGVCSTEKVAMVRSIGADQVIDYTQEDFTRSGRRYDLLLDTVGNHSLSACRRALNPNGICLMVAGPYGRQGMIGFLGRAITASVLSLFTSQKFVMCMARASREDLTILAELIKAGKVRPVIDKRRGLREVPGAIRDLEEGHARGKIVVTVEQDDNP